MPSLLVSRLDLDRLYPPFLERLLAAKAAARARGVEYWSTEGFRSYERSWGLYRAWKRGGPRAAPAGESAHNFGLATDECRQTLPLGTTILKPSWEPDDFRIFEEECIKVGLIGGRSFGDTDHFQWPKFVSGGQLLPLNNVYRTTLGDELTKLRKVWEYVDKNSPVMPELPK